MTTRATEILKASMMSRSQEGIGTIMNMTAARI